VGQEGVSLGNDNKEAALLDDKFDPFVSLPRTRHTGPPGKEMKRPELLMAVRSYGSIGHSKPLVGGVTKTEASTCVFSTEMLFESHALSFPVFGDYRLSSQASKTHHQTTEHPNNGHAANGSNRLRSSSKVASSRGVTFLQCPILSATVQEFFGGPWLGIRAGDHSQVYLHFCLLLGAALEFSDLCRGHEADLSGWCAAS